MMGEMMPKPFDPMAEIGPQDRQYLEEQRRAKARQEAAWDGQGVPMSPEDEKRKQLSDEFRRKTMASQGMTPAEIAKNFQEAPPPPATADDVGPGGPVATAVGIPTMFVVLKARADVEVHEAPQAEEQYAPDWKMLKGRIKDHNGTWVVEKYEFHPHVAFILGFFGKPGWDPPENALKESFEAFVKDGRVFRTDPE